MRAFLAVLPLLLALGGQARTVPAAQVAAPRPAPKLYDEAADAKAKIADAIKAANVDDIRVLINWGANDDEGSAKFAQALRAPAVNATRYAADEYKVVNVNVGHLDANLDLAKTYGATLAARALPALTVLDQTGKVLAQASARDFAGADQAAIDSDKVAAFLTSHQAPAPDAIAPFEAAVKQAKRDGKTVFVWFSAPW